MRHFVPLYTSQRYHRIVGIYNSTASLSMFLTSPATCLCCHLWAVLWRVCAVICELSCGVSVVLSVSCPATCLCCHLWAVLSRVCAVICELSCDVSVVSQSDQRLPPCPSCSVLSSVRTLHCAATSRPSPRLSTTGSTTARRCCSARE